MSLPRDLKVMIPGYGTDKINAAYSYGGPELTLRTVTKVTGIPINHVVNVNFEGFREAVNELGCPYIDIDRRYFNDNSGYGPDYATIDVKQGYQKLCGQDALDYVRYRHEDTDIVRAARQQEFLRQLKQQIGLTKLFEQRADLLEIFGRYTDSDIRGRAHVLQPAQARARVGTAPDPRDPLQGLDRGELRHRQLGRHEGPARRLPRPEGDRRVRAGASSGDKKKKKEPVTGLENAEVAGKDQALQLAGMGQKFPAFYPKLRTYGAIYAGPPRYYKIPVGRKGERKWYPAYRMVIKQGHASASTTGSRARRGRTRRLCATPPRRARSTAASTSCTTTATGCAWSRGARTAPSTGSRTRCCRR